MTAVWTLLLLGLAGAPLAVLACGLRAEAVVVAPLAGAGFLALSATLEVAVGGSPLALDVVILVAGMAVPFVLGRLWQAGRLHVRATTLRREGALLLAPALVLAWCLSTLQRVHVSYDGRSIWFFHARMLTGGHELYLSQARAFPFSHPDYPPLVPASVSLGWRLAGSTDYRTGQLVLAALTACATALAGLGVARSLGSASWRAPLAAAVSVAVVYGVWDEYATNGFVDPLCAALVLGSMLHGVLVPPTQRRTPLALVLLVLAAMSKNEGLSFALVVLAAIAIRQVLEFGSDERVGKRLLAAALTTVLVWPLVVHVRGIPSDLTSGGHLQGAAGRPLPRLRVVVSAFGHLLPTVSLGLFGVAAVAWVVSKGQRRRIALYLAAQALCAAALLAVYAFGPLEIHYWVTSSLNRTSMTLRAGGLLSAVYAAGTAAGVLASAVRNRTSAQRLLASEPV